MCQLASVMRNLELADYYILEYMLGLLSSMAAAQVNFELKVAGKECRSPDRSFNVATTNMTLQTCANSCANDPQCRFFIYGTGYKTGRCFAEYTASSDCPEGWEDDDYDFYAICPAGSCVNGCTERGAANYNPLATNEDGSCIEADACVARTKEGTCKQASDPYRNRANDTIYATRMADGAITVDGDLRDWGMHPLEHGQRGSNSQSPDPARPACRPGD